MAMPRHVPSTKPKPSVVTRLRLKLNQEVPKHVAKSVDAVCDAFEEELMPVYPPRDVGVDNYELFYDCCRRLAKYIETNMTTTPGFLEQMDRIILACHSGATGSVLRSVMTKDLRIRRRDRHEIPLKNGCKQVTVKVESVSVGDDQQPAISPANSTISRATSVTEGLVKAREWETRKRLSTRSRVRSKRARRSLTSSWPREENSDEEKKQGEQEGDEEGIEEEEEVTAAAEEGLCRTILKNARPVVERAQRRKCIRRQEQHFEGQEEEQKGESMEMKDQSETVQRDSSIEAKELAAIATTTSGENGDINETKHLPNAVEVTKAVEEAKPDDDKATKGGEVPEVGGQTSEIEQDIDPTDPTNNSEEIQNANTALQADRDQESQANDHGEVRKESSLTQQDKILETDSTRSEPDAALEEEEALDERAAVTTGQKQHQSIDRGQIEKEMRHLVRNLEAGEGSLDMTVARTRFQLLLQKLSGPADNAFSLAEPMDSQNEGDSEIPAAFDLDDISSDKDDDPPVPGLCDTRLRAPHQVTYFKARLRKAIIFVDAVLCQPPMGKVCSRNCEKIRARQCSESVSCRDPICRNWHRAEAHTERCNNPLCEFRNRILLREIMHQVENHEPDMKLQQAQWKAKSLAFFAVVNDEAKESFTLDQITEMSNELGQLERNLEETKEELGSMKHTRRVLLANLSAIGVKPQDDETDGFPSFEEHYVSNDNDSDVGNDC